MHSFFASDVESLDLHQTGWTNNLNALLGDGCRPVSPLLRSPFPGCSPSILHRRACRSFDVDPAAVHRAANRSPKHVPISAADQRAASRLRTAFVEVPPSDADREISPDYDL